MRRHYPLCGCVKGFEWKWIDDDCCQDRDYFNSGGIYDAICEKCRIFFWWERANDEHMQALAEMNAQGLGVK